MAAAIVIQTGIQDIDSGETSLQQRQFGNFIGGKQLGTQPVMQVMVVIGDIIRQRRNLRFTAGISVYLKIMHRIVIGQRIGDVTAHWAIVFGNPFECFPRQIKPIEISIMTL